MTQQEFAEKIRRLGGCAYIVGGWVRDKILGRQEPNDRDYVVAGVARALFEHAFFEARRVGRNFPVYLLPIDGRDCEVAFARTEVKAGTGYTGFRATADASIAIEEDLYRRDTTMNSIAYEILSGAFIDPYGGARDIQAKCIRPVSKHFSEDPVRALRAARQAAELGFYLTDETAAQMKLCRAELKKEPSERLFCELRRALATKRPSVFFRALKRAAVLDTAYPWVFRLIGKTQPAQYHPEGDAFEHTMQVVDKTAALSASLDARFCALVHDIGKGLTPLEALPHHIDHEERGIEVLRDWNAHMTLPRVWMKKAAFVIREHMRVTTMKKAGKIVDFLLALERNPLRWEEMAAVIVADHGALPLPLKKYGALLQAIRSVDGAAIWDKAVKGKKGALVPKLIRQAQIAACGTLLKGENL